MSNATLVAKRNELTEYRERLMKAREQAGDDMDLDAIDVFEGDAAAKAKALDEARKAIETLTSEVADLAGAEEALKVAAGFDTDPAPAAGSDRKGQRKGTLGEVVTGDSEVKSYLDSLKRGNRIPEGARVNAPPVMIEKALKDIIGSGSSGGGAFRQVDYTGEYEPVGRRELLLRDVIATRTTTSDVVSFVRAISRENAAAFVAEASGDPANPTGGQKPWGGWEWEEVTESVGTIAELAAVTRQTLADQPALQGLVDQELRDNLAQALEDAVIAGDGSGPNPTGILETSGTLSEGVDADDDAAVREFLAVRRAKTLLRTVGRVAANGLALHPEDAERIETRRDANGQFYGMGPFAVGPNQLWGVNRVVTEAVPQGTAILADWSKAVLWDREQTTVDMSDSHADFFARNLVAVRAEARVAFGVIRPQAFAVIDLEG